MLRKSIKQKGKEKKNITLTNLENMTEQGWKLETCELPKPPPPVTKFLFSKDEAIQL